MNAVYVAGVGMTPFGRMPDQSVKSLARSAIEAALRDAGADPSVLEGAVFSNSTQGHLEGQQMIRGQIVLRAMGIGSIPVLNVENACAGGATALFMAATMIKSGQADIVLAVGSEKMFNEDRALMFGVFDSAWDVSRVAEARGQLLALGAGVAVPEGSTSKKSYSVFMDVYAALARQHMRRYGTTQAQIAAVAAKNHRHSVHNPLAQYRDPYSTEEILASPPITYPLTLLMCSPVSDGAAAALLVSEAGLARLSAGRKRAVRLSASVIQTGSDRDAEDLHEHVSGRAARKAYELAGIGPRDISVAEVHDATAIGEIIQAENLGLCLPGEGGSLAERGETAIGGRIPINPSGGLVSKGHPIGATGLGQIYELVTQLRGEAGARQVDGAQVAIAENGGGLHGVEEAVACVSILERFG